MPVLRSTLSILVKFTMGIQFLSALTVVLLFVLCDAQTGEESHICVYPFNVPRTIQITKKCRRGSNAICSKIVTKYVKEMRTSCCEGWVYSTAESKCVADCKRGCTRGKCIAPDTCACDPPLILKNNITCEEPHCNPSCVNADCVDDDKCTCKQGFTAHNATHCAPLCPEGFINDPDKLECKPKCDNCFNGNCTAPNTCTCDEGYILENSTCVPYCNGSCNNGRCVAPNTCECSEGYSIDPLDTLQCHPICEKPCLNATCDAPNKCACLSGYETISTWACKPQCDNCNNGECIAPNQCNCLDGYFKTDGINCKPVCSKTCLNGYCSAPNTCTCNEGYESTREDKFKCQPICEDGCVNATCVAPNTCRCLFGYEKHNDSVCRPSCASCEHGVCASPDNCHCNEGFDRINGTCKPVCSSPCINGFCESPEKCACNEGYLKDLTQSVCYKPCIGKCDHGQCNIDGECLCNSGFELFNSSCIVPESCDKCNATCSEENCRCSDERPCYPTIEAPAEAATSTSLAGLQLTWVLGGCVGILLVTIVIITIGYLWRKRKEYGAKPTDNATTYPSVLYTIPNTLIPNNYDDREDDNFNEDDADVVNEVEDTNKAVSLQLLEEEEEDANEAVSLRLPEERENANENEPV